MTARSCHRPPPAPEPGHQPASTPEWPPAGGASPPASWSMHADLIRFRMGKQSEHAGHGRARRDGPLDRRPVAAAGLLAWTDWASHLACAPGKQAELASLAFRQAAQLGRCCPSRRPRRRTPLPATAAMPVKAGANGPITCGAKDSWRPSSGGNRPRRACPAWTPSRAAGGLCRAPVAGPAVAGQPDRRQPRSDAPDLAGRRRQPAARRRPCLGRRDARTGQPAARGRRRLHPRQRSPSRPARWCGATG